MLTAGDWKYSSRCEKCCPKFDCGVGVVSAGADHIEFLNFAGQHEQITEGNIATPVFPSGVRACRISAWPAMLMWLSIYSANQMSRCDDARSMSDSFYGTMWEVSRPNAQVNWRFSTAPRGPAWYQKYLRHPSSWNWKGVRTDREISTELSGHISLYWKPDELKGNPTQTNIVLS